MLARTRRGGWWSSACLDLTVLMRSGAADTAARVALSDLTDTLREQGPIPVTTERFA